MGHFALTAFKICSAFVLTIKFLVWASEIISFRVGWASWICKFMSDWILDTFSHYFFKYFSLLCPFWDTQCILWLVWRFHQFCSLALFILLSFSSDLIIIIVPLFTCTNSSVYTYQLLNSWFFFPPNFAMCVWSPETEGKHSPMGNGLVATLSAVRHSVGIWGMRTRMLGMSLKLLAPGFRHMSAIWVEAPVNHQIVGPALMSYFSYRNFSPTFLPGS